MTNRFSVDPELHALLDDFPTLDLTTETLSAIRQAGPRTGPASTEFEDRVSVTEHFCEVSDGSDPVRLLIYTPKDADAPLPLVFHNHGGGFVLFSPEVSHARNMEISGKQQCMVASVDYALAPEAQYPTQLNQCHDALAWLLTEQTRFSIDTARVVIAGESAGGGLAAALTLKLRETRLVQPILQLLQCPMLDDRTCVADIPEHIGQFAWTREANAFGWRSLLGVEPGSENVSPFAAPARAHDLSGLPPAFLVTAALDLFVMEDIDYAQRLIRAGVPTEFHVYPGAFHGFARASEARVARAYFRDADAALARALARA